jgi:hypothetical protein
LGDLAEGFFLGEVEGGLGGVEARFCLLRTSFFFGDSLWS